MDTQGGHEGLLEQAQSLLAAYPYAVVTACTSEGLPVPVPARVPIPRAQCVMPRGLDPFAPADLDVLIESFEAAKRDGYSLARLRFTVPPYSELVSVHVFDVRQQFGLLLSISVPDEDSGELASLHERPQTLRLAQTVRSPTGTFTSIDAAFVQLLGYTEAELLGVSSLEFVHPEDVALAVASWLEVTKTPGISRRVRVRYRARSGGYVWLENTSVNKLADNGGVVTDHVDISAEMQEQERVAERERLLHRLTEALPLGLVHIEAGGRISYVNSRLSTVLGMEAPAHVGDLAASIDLAHRRAFDHAVEAALAGQDSDVQVLFRTAGSRSRLCDVSLRCLSEDTANGVGAGAIACFTEVTEAVRLREQLEVQATHDALTGCLNRTAVLKVLADVAARDRQSSTGLAAVFVDLDLFKAVNDRFGHAAGDELLTIVGWRLRQMLRPADAVGRLGGDEFLLVFPNVATAQDAQLIGDRVAALFEGDIRLACGIARIGASVGVSWIRQRTATADELVAWADNAMYAAKRAGGHSAVLHHETISA